MRGDRETKEIFEKKFLWVYKHLIPTFNCLLHNKRFRLFEKHNFLMKNKDVIVPNQFLSIQSDFFHKIMLRK